MRAEAITRPEDEHCIARCSLHSASTTLVGFGWDMRASVPFHCAAGTFVCCSAVRCQLAVRPRAWQHRRFAPSCCQTKLAALPWLAAAAAPDGTLLPAVVAGRGCCRQAVCACLCERRLGAGGAQVTLCEQLQGYLAKYQDAAKSADGSPGGRAAVAPLDGMAIYTRKKVPPPPLFAVLACDTALTSCRPIAILLPNCQNKIIAGCACAAWLGAADVPARMSA